MIRSKILVLLTAVLSLTVLAGLFTACDDGGSSSSGGGTYAITFDPNGGTWADSSATNNKIVTVNANATITAPTVAVTKAGFTLAGWWTTPTTGGTELTSATKATKIDKYYARWTEIQLETAGELTVGAKYSYGKDGDQPAWDLTDPDGILTGYAAGSVLRMTFTFAEAKPAGNGIGAIGFLTPANDDAAIDNKYEFGISAAVAAGGTATIDVPVFYALSAVAAHAGATKLSVVTWSSADATLTKVELFEPTETAANPTIPGKPDVPNSIQMADCDLVNVDIDIEAGIFGIGVGKGKIKGAGFDAIVEASNKAILRLYIVNLNKENRGWGIGTIGAASIEGKAVATDFIVDVNVSDVIKGLEGDATFISTNIWSQCAIALIELWEPQEGVELPEFTLELGANSTYGTQGKLSSYLTASDPKEGDVYTFTYSITSDAAIDSLNISVNDNGNPGYPWNPSGAASITDIAANTKKDGTFTITIGRTMTTDAQHLIFETNTTVPAGTILKFWAFSFTKEAAQPPSVSPMTIYDVDDGGFMSGASEDHGITVNTTKGLTITPSSGTVEYSAGIKFASDINITGYTKITIEWNGVYTVAGDFNMYQIALGVLFSSGDAVKISHKLDVTTSPQTFGFAATVQSWDDDWEDADTTKCKGLSIFSNYQQKKDGYAQLISTEVEELYITKIILQ